MRVRGRLNGKLHVLGVILVVVVCLAAGIQWFIQREAAITGDKAAAEFGGERVEALAKLVDCGGCGLDRRNRAVWALGEMGDKRALPVLQKQHTGGKCDHARQLCRYELAKAIGKIEGTWGMTPHLARLRSSR